jgi:hypothetical protein
MKPERVFLKHLRFIQAIPDGIYEYKKAPLRCQAPEMGSRLAWDSRILRFESI